jgi:hypothetical protein
MKNIKMKIKRLRAMKVQEIFYRTMQVCGDYAEKKRMASGVDLSPEWFVSRLNGDAASVEEKFKLILNATQNRAAFAWQKKQRVELLENYQKSFSANRQATLAAADRYIAKEFNVFGKSVSFSGDIDWHYDPLGKKRIPLSWWRQVDYYSSDVVQEVKYVWELNRCQHFVTLGKAYVLTGDEKYAQGLLDQWLDWIDKNPFKFGVNWTSSLECAFRIISWTWALQFVKESRELNPGRYARILMSIENHVDFILGHLSKYSSANNHILGECVGLIYIGAYYPEFPRAQQWLKKGLSIFEKEFMRQVMEDGVNAEQAVWYHRYVFDFGVLVADAATRGGDSLSPPLMLRLEKMAEFIAALMNESGTVPAIGDDDGGQALRLMEGDVNPNKALLSVAAHMFHRRDLNVGSGEFQEMAFWLFGADEIIKTVAQPSDDTIALFRDGGYAVATVQQPKNQKLVFDCGSLGLGSMAAHGHADALSFTLSVNGEQILIDSGAFMYMGAGDERRYFRGTRAHTAVVIDGLDQSEMLGPFQWGRRAASRLHEASLADGKVVLQASHDGYRRIGVTHTRRIEHDARGWLVIDSISGVGIHQIDAYFQIAPCECSITDSGALLSFEHHELSIQFKIDSGKAATIACKEKWFSERFGSRRKHPVLCASATAKPPFIMKTRIAVDA